MTTPSDGDHAHREWKASCGPNALAGLLGSSVGSLQAAFAAVNYRGWTNQTQMLGVLRGLGQTVVKDTTWPKHGLIHVQFTGPWENPGVPAAAAYRQTHWVAIAIGGMLVYEPMVQDWMPRKMWEEVSRKWAIEEIKRCTGWRLRAGLHVAN